MPRWRNGSRVRLKSEWTKVRVGSSPSRGTVDKVQSLYYVVVIAWLGSPTAGDSGFKSRAV
jgi:hypothetical protein